MRASRFTVFPQPKTGSEIDASSAAPASAHGSSFLPAGLTPSACLDTVCRTYVIVDDKVPAATLVQAVHDIQSTGLHNLVLMSPAKHDGKDGMYKITVDATKRRFGGCIAGVEFDSGFHESPKQEAERTFLLELLNIGSPNKSMDSDKE